MTAADAPSVRGRIRGALRRVRYLPDRLLHPWRRRRARRRLASAPAPSTVLFLCFGNICRSPFAEEVFRRRVPDTGPEGVEAESAGFYPEAGRPSPAEARCAAARRGVDLTDHRSRVVSPPPSDADPLVVAMDGGQARRARRSWGTPRHRTLVLGDLDPSIPERRRILDPFGHPEEVFDEVYGRIDRCVAELARWLFAEGGG